MKTSVIELHDLLSVNALGVEVRIGVADIKSDVRQHEYESTEPENAARASKIVNLVNLMKLQMTGLSLVNISSKSVSVQPCGARSATK